MTFLFSKRCDTSFDCPDQSDELDCDYLKLGRNYAKELAPPPSHSSNEHPNKNFTSFHDLEELEVGLNITIQSLPSIDTVNLRFTADFFLFLKWHDRRLDFRNLHEQSTLNRLSSADLANMWTPQLLFINALGSLQTLADEKAMAYVEREGEPQIAGWEVATEGLPNCNR